MSAYAEHICIANKCLDLKLTSFFFASEIFSSIIVEKNTVAGGRWKILINIFFDVYFRVCCRAGPIVFVLGLDSRSGFHKRERHQVRNQNLPSPKISVHRCDNFDFRHFCLQKSDQR